MFTWFHFVRLQQPADGEVHAMALRRGLGPDVVVGRPADAHARAAWCLSVRRTGPDLAALQSTGSQVERLLGDAVKVHKGWAFEEVPR
jgi:hypothetical protein